MNRTARNVKAFLKAAQVSAPYTMEQGERLYGEEAQEEAAERAKENMSPTVNPMTYGLSATERLNQQMQGAFDPMQGVAQQTAQKATEQARKEREESVQEEAAQEVKDKGSEAARSMTNETGAGVSQEAWENLSKEQKGRFASLGDVNLNAQKALNAGNIMGSSDMRTSNMGGAAQVGSGAVQYASNNVGSQWKPQMAGVEIPEGLDFMQNPGTSPPTGRV